MKLLIAEDERDLRLGLQVFFRRNHFTVDAVENGAEALQYLRLGGYDAAVLDVMMPEMDGISVVQQLRREQNQTPILLLTARSEIEDRVEGLDAGANDYLPKPFDLRELLARVRVLTRSRPEETARLTFGSVTLDTAAFSLIGPKGERSLTGKEYQILHLLMQTPGVPVSVERMMSKAWDAESIGLENALWTVMYNLRKKLGEVGGDVAVRNKRNLGYVLEVRG